LKNTEIYFYLRNIYFFFLKLYITTSSFILKFVNYLYFKFCRS